MQIFNIQTQEKAWRIRGIPYWWGPMVKRRLGPLSTSIYDRVSQDLLSGTAWWSSCIALLQLYGAVLEHGRGRDVLMWLDLASAALAICGAAVCMARLPVRTRRTLATFCIAVAMLCEVETAFHDPEYAFYDSRQYVIIIVATLFLAVIFPGRPAVFLAFALAFAAAYIVRSLAETPGRTLSEHSIAVFGYQLVLSAVASAGLHCWIFRLRYINIKQADEIRHAYRKLGRQMMMRDIHDYLGSRLADISNLAEKVKRDRSDATVEALATTASNTAQLLRRGLIAEKDREMLEEDFGNALRVILFGRYEAAGREIWIRYREDSHQRLNELGGEHRRELHAIALEMTTNDLKYGGGTAVLDIRPAGQNLRMRFFSSTTTARSAGVGSRSLAERTTRLGGSCYTRVRSPRILIQILLPLQTQDAGQHDLRSN